MLPARRRGRFNQKASREAPRLHERPIADCTASAGRRPPWYRVLAAYWSGHARWTDPSSLACPASVWTQPSSLYRRATFAVRSCFHRRYENDPRLAMEENVRRRRRATKRRRSSITELAFQGIHTSRQMAKSVTHVFGTRCHLCLGPLTSSAIEMTKRRRAATLPRCGSAQAGG